MPTKSEKIGNQAADLLNRNNYLAAFELAANRLMADPGNEKLIDIATNAARIQIDNILVKEGPAQALRWLNKELLNKNYPNSLRELLPPLDTKAVVEQLKGSNYSDQEKEKKLSELLERYSASSKVPLDAARQLQGKINYYYPLSLYAEALKRGAIAEQQIFDFCTLLMTSKAPGNIEQAHAIIKKHFPEQGVTWAADILDKDMSGNHQPIINGWKILQENNNFRVNDPYFQSLLKFVSGLSRGEKEADQVIKVFLTIDNDFRQKQLLTIARKRVLVRSGSMHEIERVLQILEENLPTPR